MVFNNPYLCNQEKYDLLAKWLIVHSYIYYELDSNVVTDKMFDNNTKQFLELVEAMSKREQKECKWYYVMKEFDGSTGFHLFKLLNNYHMEEVMTLGKKLTNKTKIKTKKER